MKRLGVIKCKVNLFTRNRGTLHRACRGGITLGGERRCDGALARSTEGRQRSSGRGPGQQTRQKGQVLQLGAKIVLHLLCIWTGQAFERTASDSRSESSSPFTGPLERQSAAQFQQVIEGLRGESTVIQARIKQRTDMLVRLSMFPDLRWKSYFPPPTLNQDGRTTILAPLRWRNRLGLRGEKRPAGADRRGPGGDRASMALPQ